MWFDACRSYGATRVVLRVRADGSETKLPQQQHAHVAQKHKSVDQDFFYAAVELAAASDPVPEYR